MYNHNICNCFCLRKQSNFNKRGHFFVETKRVLTKDLLPGMIVMEDIFTSRDQLLITSGEELNNHSITRLKFHSINDVKIQTATTKTHFDMKESIADSYSEYVKGTIEFAKFHTALEKATKAFKYTVSSLVDNPNAPIDVNILLEQNHHILEESRNGTHVFHMLNCLKENDDLTYAHSVQVGIICNIFGRWLKMSQQDIDTLTICGMLHDVGKLMIPPKIISKAGSLTKGEYNVVQNHPMDGYRMLEHQPLDERVKLAALMHHERCDGSGYPDHLMGNQIDEFAKIVAIADIYDAMTCARVYRSPLCPFDVISVFEQEGLHKFDPHYSLTFLESIVNTYVNCTVRLSDGRIGDIIMIDNKNLTRPVVKVGASFIDLAKKRDLSIVAII